MATNKQKFNRKFGLDKDTAHSKASITRLTGISKKDLDEIYDRGKAAFYNNPSSVRPNVKSADQWSWSRIYAFIMKTYDGISKNKEKINQDNDIYEKYKKKGLKSPNKK
jgi:hypothetical protein